MKATGKIDISKSTVPGKSGSQVAKEATPAVKGVKATPKSEQ